MNSKSDAKKGTPWTPAGRTFSSYKDSHTTSHVFILSNMSIDFAMGLLGNWYCLIA